MCKSDRKHESARERQTERGIKFMKDFLKVYDKQNIKSVLLESKSIQKKTDQLRVYKNACK